VNLHNINIPKEEAFIKYLTSKFATLEWRTLDGTVFSYRFRPGYDNGGENLWIQMSRTDTMAYRNYFREYQEGLGRA
jgi:hypothetical protein